MGIAFVSRPGSAAPIRSAASAPANRRDVHECSDGSARPDCGGRRLIPDVSGDSEFWRSPRQPVVSFAESPRAPHPPAAPEPRAAGGRRGNPAHRLAQRRTPDPCPRAAGLLLLCMWGPSLPDESARRQSVAHAVEAAACWRTAFFCALQASPDRSGSRPSLRSLPQRRVLLRSASGTSPLRHLSGSDGRRRGLLSKSCCTTRLRASVLPAIARASDSARTARGCAAVLRAGGGSARRRGSRPPVFSADPSQRPGLYAWVEGSHWLPFTNRLPTRKCFKRHVRLEVWSRPGPRGQLSPGCDRRVVTRQRLLAMRHADPLSARCPGRGAPADVPEAARQVGPAPGSALGFCFVVHVGAGGRALSEIVDRLLAVRRPDRGQR